jgi:hypothetical protein
MANVETTESLVNVLRDTVVALVRQDGPDLSARQFGVFLTCYLEGDAQTVRGLAAALDVSKPVISSAAKPTQPTGAACWCNGRRRGPPILKTSAASCVMHRTAKPVVNSRHA